MMRCIPFIQFIRGIFKGLETWHKNIKNVSSFLQAIAHLVTCSIDRNMPFISLPRGFFGGKVKEATHDAKLRCLSRDLVCLSSPQCILEAQGQARIGRDFMCKVLLQMLV